MSDVSETKQPERPGVSTVPSAEKEVLRVSEIYASIQGEGPRTGMATVFLRFGGCNLRCPGWPCDTFYAIDPSFRDEWKRGSGRSVLDETVRTCRERNIENVCLTGGEPFLQSQAVLEFLVRGLLDADIQVEAFTNGQIGYQNWAFDLVNFTMDWKLPGSGNPATELTEENITYLKPTDAIKFVIRDRADFEWAVTVWERREHTTQAQWWAGVVWDAMPEAQLVEWMQAESLPWNLNVQTHKYLWPASKRGV